MSRNAVYVVAATRPWNRKIFHAVIKRFPGTWHLVTTPDALRGGRVAHLNPRSLFFLHWSWKVPREMVERYECVGFHMTDLPYGRGGSPLQHLILRGHKTTTLTAFRMTHALDAGPVYLKADLALTGPAHAIYVRASRLAATMIRRLITGGIRPIPQAGRPVVFTRRTPAQSRIATSEDRVGRLYNFIRMLDADDYPPAFLEYGRFRYEFSNARPTRNRMTANVTITPAAGRRP